MTQDEIDAVFHPERPVTKRGLLVGREQEVQRTVTRLRTAGGHVLISGHRGIGKTSIARVAENILRVQNPSLVVEYVQCDSSTTFSYLAECLLVHCGPDVVPAVSNSPARAAKALANLKGFLLIDEVDRLRDQERTLLGEFMKALSDLAATFSICVVGIARTAADIFAGHLSVHRCLNEVHVGRLLIIDISKLVDDGFRALKQLVRGDVVQDISKLSQGFPSNAVAICRNAVECLLRAPSLELGPIEFRSGLRHLLEERGAAPMEILQRIYSDMGSDLRRILLVTAGFLETEEFSADRMYTTAATQVRLDRQSFDDIVMGLCLEGPEKVFDMTRPGILRFADPRMPMVVSITEYLRS